MADISCLIDDFGPLPVVRPASVAELGDLVRRAAAEKQAVYPVGGRTMLGLGRPPTLPGVAVDLTGLDQVIDYPARDMTITVQAGITIARLHELLRAENQRLPVDVPRPETATLGGALAANVSGPRRLGYGTLRDYVIGISVVNDEGHEVKAGGRVVKNVAGYDLMKLYVGSLGTLGVITRVTLKVRPVPAARRVVVMPCGRDDVGPVLDILHRSRTRPVCVELLNQNAFAALNVRPRGRWILFIGFEESAAAVDWQTVELIGKDTPYELEKLTESLPEGEGAAILSALTDFPLWPEAGLTFKANLLPSALADFCIEANALPDALLLQAHAGSGVVIGHAPATLTRERAAAMLTLLTERAAAAQGNVVVLRCPPAWKADLNVWGSPRGDAWLMRAVKEKLDPGDLFNPGRFVV